MLSVSSIFNEIKNNDEAFAFFVSVAAKGETQGGWENDRIAALTRDEALAAKIRKHGEDETRHGKLFGALLKRRNLEMVEVPESADYCMRLERRGIGLAHSRLEQGEALSVDELLAYLAHSRVTEQRAFEEVHMMTKVFRDDPEIGPAVRMIEDDEINHLSYCHEELIRVRDEGHGAKIEAILPRYARAEIETYRDVGLDFVDRMGRILGWNRGKRGLLKMGVRGKYAAERAHGWRRMVRLAPPERPGAMSSELAASS